MSFSRPTDTEKKFTMNILTKKQKNANRQTVSFLRKFIYNRSRNIVSSHIILWSNRWNNNDKENWKTFIITPTVRAEPRNHPTPPKNWQQYQLAIDILFSEQCRIEEEHNEFSGQFCDIKPATCDQHVNFTIKGQNFCLNMCKCHLWNLQNILAKPSYCYGLRVSPFDSFFFLS